jgi:hypothetical protein
VTESVLPVGLHSQRQLFAAETTNETALAEAVEKMMKNDKAVQIRTTKVDDKEYKIFLIIPEGDQVPMLDVQNIDGPNIDSKVDSKEPAKEAAAGPNDKLLPHSAIAVAHGHLFIATHIDLLEEVLKSPVADKLLSSADDYQRLEKELGKIHAGPRSLQGFTRDSERFQVQYELFRQGHLPEADLLVTQAFNALLDEGLEEGQIRHQSLDGSKLPPFESIQKYLGLGGVYSQSVDDGWVIVGFTLDEVDQRAQNANAQAAKEVPPAK